MKPNSFLEIEQSHLALAQFYRWFQLYERPLTDERRQHALALLADDVEIQSVNGAFKGHAAFLERLALYDGWKTAHHVQFAAVKPLTPDTLELVGHVLFQNIRPDGNRHSYNLQYDARLALIPDELPVFTSIKLTPTGNVEPVAFEDAYPVNRVSSLLHYWLYCMETHNGDASRMRELYTPEFELYTATAGHLSNWEQVQAWIGALPVRISYSSHHIRDLTVQANADSTFSASFILDWQGISSEGEPMIAELQHEWLVEDNPNNRFAALKNVRIVTTEPFQINYSL
ncbi:hypothetical protein [Hymenobacter sp. DG25A]|uniref:hypothetical protein n=1 Tax=Hymenobacter sp. DG25A TaxID=1385663 RepID=UPI0006BCE9DF|nr:hypothetical protein [Hymenobacter sp. DG25A]ALD21704.1 hypothetical protein AM218_11420 [Hymenobacter sp. DG25A]